VAAAPHFDEAALGELVASVSERGVLQPLLVRKVKSGYELIAGERRFRAAQAADLKDVPVVVLEVSDREALELALIENLQREDLNLIEEAEGYRALADKFSLTQEEIAARMGKARPTVANALRLLELPDAVKRWSRKTVEPRPCQGAAGLAHDEQEKLALRVVAEGLSVRQVEKLVAASARAARSQGGEIGHPARAPEVCAGPSAPEAGHGGPPQSVPHPGQRPQGQGGHGNRVLLLGRPRPHHGHPGRCGRSVMKRARSVLLALSICLVAWAAGRGKSAPTEPAVPLEASHVDGERALYEVHRLVALGARDAGTPGAERAAQHLKKRLQELGVEARIDTFTNQTPLGARAFHNVIGRIPGTRSGLILAGLAFRHQVRHRAGFPGGQRFRLQHGGAAGTGAPAGQTWFARPGNSSAVFRRRGGGAALQRRWTACTAAGITPSAWWRRGGPSEVLAMILLDMIGDRDLSVTIPRNVTRELAIALLRAADAEGQRDKFVLFPFEVGDDHEPFLRRGMPALNIIDFQYGSAPGRNDYWHTRLDTLDKLSADSLGLIGRVTIRIMQDVTAQAAER
jgi:ParB/RepB/Spo0J family partition protein